MSESMEQKNQPQTSDDTKESGKIVDSRSLNEMIDKMIKGKD
jgi:hypothetical protein